MTSAINNRVGNKTRASVFALAAKMVTRSVMAGLLLSTVLLGSNAALGQDLFLEDQLGFGKNPALIDNPVQLSGDFQLKPDSRLGILNVRASIANRWHLYSVTQKKGGPIRSKIQVTESVMYKVIGTFTPDEPPHVEENVEGFDVPVEDHEVAVVWSAPIELADGVDPDDVTIEITFNGQTCLTKESGELGTCKLVNNVKIDAQFDGYESALQVNAPEDEKTLEPFRPKMSHADFTGRIVRADGIPGPIEPGAKITFELTANAEGDYHVYQYERERTSDDSRPTLVGFEETNGWKILSPVASAEPKKHAEPAYLYHEDPVTWSFDIQVPDNVEAKNYSLSGQVAFQTCTHTGCDPPGGVKFSVVIPVGSTMAPIPVKFEGGTSYGKAEAAVKSWLANEADAATKAPAAGGESVELRGHKDTPAEIAEMAALYDAEEKINFLTLSELEDNPVGTGAANLVRGAETTIWTAMFGAFFGGMLLNLMPCVFPVLGLKVMGFVEQAGSDPKKIRMHGIAFAMGLVVSMWILAGIILTLKIAFGQSVNWGAQMGNPYFVVSIIVLLFMLGLNMAGVFEIGTSLTRVGGGVQQKKGYTSSFFSGVLTTLIATPCSGPFLGAAMGYTLAQPAGPAMFLFTVFALGIASPYIVLSFAPGLINKLPRPGAWMETFKIMMAFVLFAVVAFFMQTFGGQTGVGGLSWLVMALVVLGMASFFYGTWSLPHIKPTKRKLLGFALPLLIAGAGIWMCYDAANQRSENATAHNAGGLDWQAWNPGKVQHLLSKKKRIVWVDYTADW